VKNDIQFKSPYLVKPGSRVKLKALATRDSGKYKNEEGTKQILAKHRDQLAKLQEVLYAGATNGVLIVLQGMDTAGKDGTIRHIFSGVNPQGCNVTSFKVPTPLEAKHDFLWRCHNAVPPRGMIGIFNRSHYEDVLSPCVHGLIDKKTARMRMEQINDFEQLQRENGILVLKFFLHISHEEQTRRLQERISMKDKHWKLSASDFAERRFWQEYAACYEDLLERTSAKHAPWFVIPSDHKWYRNIAISEILMDAMRQLHLKYPPVTVDVSTLKL